ncbi:hypothetical protein LINGRAHAP2_LOCUS20360, partial [Linum grandiflorum]
GAYLLDSAQQQVEGRRVVAASVVAGRGGRSSGSRREEGRKLGSMAPWSKEVEAPSWDEEGSRGAEVSS